MANFLHDNAPKFSKEYEIAPLDLRDKVSICVSIIYKMQIPLELIEVPLNHRERTDGDIIRQEISNYENGRFKPIVVIKTTNPEKPYRMLRGDNRYDAIKSLGLVSIPAILENRWSEGGGYSSIEEEEE